MKMKLSAEDGAVIIAKAFALEVADITQGKCTLIDGNRTRKFTSDVDPNRLIKLVANAMFQLPDVRFGLDGAAYFAPTSTKKQTKRPEYRPLSRY